MPSLPASHSIRQRIGARLSRSGLGYAFRFARGLAVGLFFVFALMVLTLRHVVLPQIENYRGEVETALAAAIQLPVSIGGIAGRMEGIRPRLDLRGLAIQDDAGRPALLLDHVTAVVAWSSVLSLSPRFELLQVDAPSLAIRRDKDGRFFVAGLPVAQEQTGPDLSAWVLKQHKVAIRNARVTWSDELRRAAPLVLDDLDLQLENGILGHRFGMTAKPPPGLAARLDIRGKFSGDSIKELERWKGELYGEFGYADLAGWHAWVDYPFELRHGRGAARLWLTFARLRPTAVTLDMSLADVEIRLARDLAPLPLQHLNGRIAARNLDDGFEFSTRQLSLATRDGIVVAPTDLHLRRNNGTGNFTVNKLDLAALSAVGAHLPLPPDLRRQLAAYAASGTLNQFSLRWQGSQWPFAKYAIKGDFANLALASVDGQPGFSGLSGTIDGDESAGILAMTGRQSSLTLPAVFHEPLRVDAIDTRVRWKRHAGSTQLVFERTTFRNADADGTANGSYEIHEKGKGSIDVDARLTRADAAAIWRYLPRQAGPHVGPFLEAGLTRGKVTEATLKLKGDLDRFPFADRGGVFRVHGVFSDAALRYAKGWPQIEDAAGTIDFDGATMTINTSQARLSGLRIQSGKATIPRLGAAEPQLLVEGKSSGPTDNFLKFIEASPVGEHIGHFTKDMTASGNGELELKLGLSLHHLDRAAVNGRYRFDANRLAWGPEMPSLDDVRGQVEFTADSLRARGVGATILGLPLKADLRTQADGIMVSDIVGEANPALLRSPVAPGLFKNLAGSARWNGTVRIRKKAVDIRISSDLVGLSSNLPEPFNKAAKDPMPVSYERKAADARWLARRPRDGRARNIVEMAIGRAVHAQLVYRDDIEHSVFERGLITVGDVAVRLPERGLTLAIFAPRIDADRWRSVLLDTTEKPAAPRPGRGGPHELAPNRIDLRSNELQLFGRVFHDVRINAVRPADSWTADIGSREAVAKLEWADLDDGPKLSGRITRLALPEAAEHDGLAIDALQSLPNLDLSLDHLVLGGRDYGELRFVGVNQGGDWNATVSVKNEDGALETQGRWRAAAAGASETQADFKLRARNLERFLNRIGYPNMVKRGKADLSGKLTWKGAPHEFDIATLSGQLSLDARDGQFNKLEPGVGRLLGILSLQSIPRRITLDFRDIFSEGMAFDSMKGQVAAANGILTTQNMEIRGPAARIQMAGSVDLNNETQDLKVRVQPKLSDSVATGALLVNPAVGATAWVFNKLFGNPLDNAFAYDYAVTGSWLDPAVDKIGAQAAASAQRNLNR